MLLLAVGVVVVVIVSVVVVTIVIDVVDDVVVASHMPCSVCGICPYNPIT